MDCGHQFWGSTRHFRSPQDAIAAWNRRAPSPVLSRLQQENEALQARIDGLGEQAAECASLLEVFAEEAQKRGDIAAWSMMSVMADNARAALSQETPAQAVRE